MTDPSSPGQPPLNAAQLAAECSILEAFKAEVDEHLGARKQLLQQALLDIHATTGVKPAVKVELPGVDETGQYALPECGDAITVTDEEALAEFIEEHHPSEVEWVRKVRPNFLDAYLKALKATGADFGTGEVVDHKLADEASGEVPIVPGVKAVKGVGFKAPSFTGKKAMHKPTIDALRQGRLQAALPSSLTGQVVEESPLDLEPLPAVEDLKGMQRADLLPLCERLGLDHMGTPAQLRKRIAAALAGDAEVAA